MGSLDTDTEKKDLKQLEEESSKVCISDTKSLVEPDPKSSSRVGYHTWIIAAICLPVVGVCLLCTVFLVGEPTTRIEAAQLQGGLQRNNMIFILDIDNNEHQREKQAVIKSALRVNNRSELYLIALNLGNNKPKNTQKWENLKSKYPNFHYLSQSLNTFFRDSYFADNVKSTDDPNIILFKAQLLTLWRYGGVVLSPTWTPLKPFDQSSLCKDDTLSVVLYNGKVGLLATTKSCNSKIFEMMKEAKNMNPMSESFEADVIDRVLLRSKSGMNKIGFPFICNENTKSDACMIMKTPLENPVSSVMSQVGETPISSGASQVDEAPSTTHQFYHYVPLFRRFYLY